MKQGNDMKKILLFIGSMTFMSSGYLMAGNMMPPAGPYESIEGDISSFNHEAQNANGASNFQQQNMPGNEQDDIPEWVKQRQVEMNNWLKQQNDQASRQRTEQPTYQSHPLQQGNQQTMQWNQRQVVPMNRTAPQLPPQAVNPQFSQPQPNRMNQYFPASRGPVYGPNVPPPPLYNIPNYQNEPPVNQYSPMWRQ